MTHPPFSCVSIKRLNVDENLLVDSKNVCALGKLIKVSADLYTLKKRLCYLIGFKQYVVAKVRGLTFKKPMLNADMLEDALTDIIKYVQSQCFEAAVQILKRDSADAFDAILKRINQNANNAADIKRVSELKTLRNLRPCVGTNSILRVEGRLENAEMPPDGKYPIILSGSHALTRLIVLHEYVLGGNAGPSYTLMKIRQRFWIIHEVSNVKRFLSECSRCARRKVILIRQLMANLSVCRVTATNKPFKFSGVDYLNPFVFRQNRSDCKAWGLLFTCLCTRCIHMEIVISLDFDSFLLAFSRFTNLRGAVDTVYSDYGSTFKAAADKLPALLGSTELHYSLRKKCTNWVFIPPYASSQGGSWEIMVELFKKALTSVIGEARRKPSLIELQTFTSHAERIVNDRPLTTLSCEPNDLAPITDHTVFVSGSESCTKYTVKCLS